MKFELSSRFLAVFRGFSRFSRFSRPKNFPVVGRDFCRFLEVRIHPCTKFQVPRTPMPNATTRFWRFSWPPGHPSLSRWSVPFFLHYSSKNRPPAKFQHSRTFPRFKITIYTSSISPDSQLYIPGVTIYAAVAPMFNTLLSIGATAA